VKALRRSHCEACGLPVWKGQDIAKLPSGHWGHRACKEAALNAVLVRHGLTFRGTPAPYRRKVRRE